MPDNSSVWTQEQEAEAALLNAILTALALKSKVDPATFIRVPSLYDFIAMAGKVAKEIGWGDEPAGNIEVG